MVVVLLSASILVNQAGAYNEHRLYADDLLLKLPAASWKIYRGCSDPDVWGRRYRTTTRPSFPPYFPGQRENNPAVTCIK